MFACHNQEIANQWVTFIIQGAIYTNYLEENLEKEVKKSAIQGVNNSIASYFDRIKDEIELDDLPPDHQGINNQSQAKQHKQKGSLLNRFTNSFQVNRKIQTKKKEEIKKTNEKDLQAKNSHKTSNEKVNFKSFQLLSVLGSGAFGKVYKVLFVLYYKQSNCFQVKKRDNQKIYAMKVLRKRNLILKNQLKYAVTEANVFKMTDHPFVLGLHYTFQVNFIILIS